jgi:hypothetical protein
VYIIIEYKINVVIIVKEMALHDWTYLSKTN